MISNRGQMDNFLYTLVGPKYRLKNRGKVVLNVIIPIKD